MTALPVAFSTSALACYDERGLDLPPGLPFDRWQAVGEALCHMERNIGWWLGDWWRYGERTYGEAAALAAPTGYALGTVKNAAWVANRFPESSRRRDDLTFKHHQEVAPLEPRRADALLAKAAGEGLSARDLRYEVQRLRHDERMGLVRAEARPLAELQRFSILLADPPWRFEDAGLTRAVENHYPTMALDDICEMKVPAADNAVLYLWAPSPKLHEAMSVLDAWDFEYRTCLVWVKDKIGMGYYARQRHELLLVARRGNLPVPAAELRPDSVIEAPRGEHSAKPIAAHEIIERCWPGLPKVELFARRARPGWVAWGDQV